MGNLFKCSCRVRHTFPEVCRIRFRFYSCHIVPNRSIIPSRGFIDFTKAELLSMFLADCCEQFRKLGLCEINKTMICNCGTYVYFYWTDLGYCEMHKSFCTLSVDSERRSRNSKLLHLLLERQLVTSLNQTWKRYLKDINNVMDWSFWFAV